LNGVVMVSYMEERRKEGLAAAAAAWQAGKAGSQSTTAGVSYTQPRNLCPQR
jgi:hypothetical protein